MDVSKEKFRELILAFLWRQWSALGVAGVSQTADNWLIDPEALLLATTSLGREARLFDEVMDWLNLHGQFVNIQRLQNLSQRFGGVTVLQGMAAHLAQRSVHSKWKTLLREATGEPGVAKGLFPGVPVIGAKDELFARYGWLRGPIHLRGLSRPIDPHRPSSFLIKLRALFGMQARAEIIAYLLAKESGSASEMAQQLSYFPKTVQTTLNDMVRSGHLQVRRERHEKRFWLRRQDWRFLVTWPSQLKLQPSPAVRTPKLDTPGSGLGEKEEDPVVDFPRWLDWAAFYVGMESVARFLNRPAMDQESAEVQAIELRSAVDALDPTFLRETIHIPPGSTGAGYVQSVMEEFLHLLR